MSSFTKLTLLLLFVLGVWQTGFAQRNVGAAKAVAGNFAGSAYFAGQGSSRGTNCDTLSNIFTTDSVRLFGINGAWGYLSGTNQYNDVSKVDLYTNTGSAQVTQALVGFGVAEYGNINNTVRVGVWDDNGAAGAPGTLLGFQNITIASIQPDIINGDFTLVTFSTPVTVNGNFYLGITLTGNPGDTVALYTTQSRTSAINTAWEQWSDLTWHSYPSAWTNFNASHWVFPILCQAGAAPVANFSGTPTTITAGGSVNFTDLSSGSPTSWSWTFTGGTPASSTLQTPPAITYNTPGTYPVSLTVTNANGTDNETKTGYIQVNSGGGGSNTYVDCDTFANFNLNNVTPALYLATNGYYSGHNNFGDSSKAEFITNSLPGTPVSAGIFVFEVAEFANTSRSVRIKVWDANGAGGTPGTVLATQSVTISSIAADIANNRVTVVNFTNPPTPAGNYYIGVSYSYFPGDTIALLTTSIDDVIPGTAWEQWSNGTWHNYNDPTGNDVDLAHYIFPIQCATVPCPTISATFTTTQPVCTAANGSITATGTGGLAPYTFAWSGGPTGATRNNLIAGSYTVTVTDANGCTGTSTATLTPTSPTINPNITTTPAVCIAQNGSATAAPTGGTGPYTYSWSGGGNTASITGRAAGTYTVTITDANGCSTVGTANIAASSGTLAATASSTAATCTASNGTATANVTGGTPNYTYSWSGGGSTATITGRAAGTYTVTVTDANGCSATASTTVTASSGNLTLATSTTNATCGAATGSATVTPTGGTTPLTYSWSNNGSTATINNLLAGTYTVTVTDANGCSATATATVVDPGSPTVSIGNVQNVTCFGLTNGAATANVTGGTGTITYAWSNGGNTASVTGLGSGNIGVTITDGNGCSATASGTIGGPTGPLAATVTVNNNVSCPGATNGSLTANAVEGTAPYSYTWSGSTSTTATAAGLAPGNYTVTVTDAAGCTTTASGTVAPPSNPISVSVNNAQTTGCGLANASLTATVTSGATPITYLWSTSPAQNTQTATGLGAGVYRVTVTDAGGCTATASGTVTEPGAHTIAAAVTPVTCNGGNNGSVTITPTGGSGNFTYTWVPNVSTTASATGLTAGTYTVTVRDNTTGCTAVTAANVAQPDTIGLQITQTNVTCFGGNNGVVSVLATGGNGGYTYNWLTNPPQSGVTLTGLTAGAYILQVTDNQSCSKNFTITITQPQALTLSITKNDVSCNGGNNGSALISATGGTGNVTFVWSNAQTGANASNLAAGTFTVTATDANSCTAVQTVTINQPTALAATTTVTNASCFNGANGSATVSATGGTGNYTYVWGTNPTQNTATASNLRAGTYSVTVTDANNCTVLASATVTEPTLITVTTTSTPVACAGGSTGSATANATGGTGPYTYQWPSGTGATVNNLAAGTYTVTVTDANTCTVTAVATVAPASAFTASVTTTPTTCQGGNTGTATANVTGGVAPLTYAWSVTGNTSTLNNLAAGNYSVTITDANGCTATASGTVGSASGITINPTPVAASCNGGTDGGINITVSGGAGNYTYAWSNGTSNQNLSGVAAGTYGVTVTDANGCSAAASTLVVGEASGINLTVNTTNETAAGANNGTATATATGGTGLITFNWSNNASGSNLTNLAPGTYTVTATDANNCSATATGTVSGFVGISNVGLVVELNMFPNPTEGKINMNLTLAQPEAVTVEWYNAIGERVLAESFESGTTFNHTFDLGSMAAGVYYARINYAGQTNVERVVLSK